MQPGQTPHGQQEVPIGARIILGPHGIAMFPILAAGAAITETAEAAGSWSERVHQPGKCPLGFFQIIRRQLDVSDTIFDAIKLAERPLEGTQSPESHDATRDHPETRHASSCVRLSSFTPTAHSACFARYSTSKAYPTSW
jgi:hypothetical protein